MHPSCYTRTLVGTYILALVALVTMSCAGLNATGNDELKGTNNSNACKACHTIPPDFATAIWNYSPGPHGNCSNCHTGDNHPPDPATSPDPPSSICSTCHYGNSWDALHDPEDATVCLNCHLYPHVPLPISLQYGMHVGHKDQGISCNACHKVMGGIMPDRDTCLLCHPDPPQHDEVEFVSECRICHKT